MIALLLQAVTLALGALLFRTPLEWMPDSAPPDPGGSLDTLWQVHGVFVSLAFAGLTILFQLGSEALVTGRSLRIALFRHTLFKFTFAFSVLSLVQLGIVAVWLPDDSTLILEFIVAASALGLVTYAYAQAAGVFEEPDKGERLGRDQLRSALVKSQHEAWAISQANRRLRTALPALIGSPPGIEGLVRSGLVTEEGIVKDINLGMLRRVLTEFPTLAPRAKPAKSGVAQVLTLSPAPELRMQGLVGSASGRDDPVFHIYHSDLSERRLRQIERRLRACLEMSRER